MLDNFCMYVCVGGVGWVGGRESSGGRISILLETCNLCRQQLIY